MQINFSSDQKNISPTVHYHRLRCKVVHDKLIALYVDDLKLML